MKGGGGREDLSIIPKIVFSGIGITIVQLSHFNKIQSKLIKTI